MNAMRLLLPILAIALSPLPAHAQDPEPDTMRQHAHPVYELRQYTLHPGQRAFAFPERIQVPLVNAGFHEDFSEKAQAVCVRLRQAPRSGLAPQSDAVCYLPVTVQGNHT